MRDDKTSIAVVGWDMSHNALGRSWVLADVLRHRGWQVQLAGPLCQGRQVWAPLREATPGVNAFLCRGMADVMHKCAMHVEANPHRVVVVSKQRFPSMLLGLLYKRRWGARVIVDIDDHEMTLGGVEAPLDPSIIRRPPGNVLPDSVRDPMWTAFGEGMLDLADAITVAGAGLQQRYGGDIVRHARDRRVFDRSLYDAAACRRQYGLPADGRLVMFLGTPRAHKGVERIAAFIHASGAPDLRLCVTDRFSEPQERARLLAAACERLVWMPSVPLSQAPALLSTASFVCLPQDESSCVSRYQVPAKISDAIAMQVPVLMTPTPAVADLSALGVFVNEGALDEAAFARAVTAPPEQLQRVVDRASRVYEEQFTYEAAGAVLDRLAREESSKPVPGWGSDVLAMVDSVSAAMARRGL